MFKSPGRKLVAFLEKSRKGWKQKCQAAKARGKYWANQARAVRRSREAWRAQAEASACEVEQLREALATGQARDRTSQATPDHDAAGPSRAA
jgi:hypothetical protein